MRRLWIPLVAGVIVLAVVVAAVVFAVSRAIPSALASGPAPETVPAAAAISGQPVRADVNDFTFDSFDAEYRLGRDADGHATLTTTETLTARFPDYDQNRGIRRSLPALYQGHTTQLQVASVTDENGQPRPYEVAYEGSVVDIVAAVPEGQFVRGPQTYVITYTQRDVVDAFVNSGAEEFYWNLNGTDWAQPFARVSGSVVLEDGLEAALIGQEACYRGYGGSTDGCEVVRVDDTFTVTADLLNAYQTVTIAIGFAPGTFALFDNSPFASVWGWLAGLSVLLGIAATIAAIVLRMTRFRDARGRPFIVAEYGPPPGLSLLDAAILTRHKPRAVASQLVDFAVRRVITIIESPAGWFALRSTWRLRLESASGVDGKERQLLTYFFGGGLQSGAEHTLTAKNTTLSLKIQSQLTRVAAGVVTRGWRSTIPARYGLGFSLLMAAALVGVFVSTIALAEEGRGEEWGVLLAPLMVVLFLIMAARLYSQPLTSKGAELVDHIKGLEVYIKLAEADRLRVLQSPQGALREPVDATSRDERLKLIERLLPWAVMLKQEREWAKQLGEFYAEGQSPAWFSSSNQFTVASFAAGVGSVSSTLSSSYSGSSSSGGSSGGGSSGGGGGGGGGGGV